MEEEYICVKLGRGTRYLKTVDREGNELLICQEECLQKNGCGDARIKYVSERRGNGIIVKRWVWPDPYPKSSPPEPDGKPFFPSPVERKIF